MGPVRIDVKEEVDIVEVRQAGRDMARALGFGVVDQTRIASALSELTRNILLYAGSGRVTLQGVERGSLRGMEAVCEDAGPGIENVDIVLQQGFTTSGGLGLGLPGTRRLMDEFDILSKVGVGTRIVVRKWLP